MYIYIWNTIILFKLELPLLVACLYKHHSDIASDPTNKHSEESACNPPLVYLVENGVSSNILYEISLHTIHLPQVTE